MILDVGCEISIYWMSMGNGINMKATRKIVKMKWKVSGKRPNKGTRKPNDGENNSAAAPQPQR